jgi:hypothetical protein
VIVAIWIGSMLLLFGAIYLHFRAWRKEYLATLKMRDQIDFLYRQHVTKDLFGRGRQ